MPAQLTTIIRLIRIIWVNSPFYNTRERLTGLFRKLSNEIIRLCSQAHGQNSIIFKCRISSCRISSNRVQNLTDTGEDYFLLFFDASERREWISAESKILASTFGRCRLYRLKPCTNCFIFLLDSNLDHIKVNFTREDFRRRSEKFCTKSNSVYRMLRQVENDLPKNSLVAT